VCLWGSRPRSNLVAWTILARKNKQSISRKTCIFSDCDKCLAYAMKKAQARSSLGAVPLLNRPADSNGLGNAPLSITDECRWAICSRRDGRSLWLAAFDAQIDPLDRFDRLCRSRLTYQSTTDPSSASNCGRYGLGSPTWARSLFSSMVMPNPGSVSSGR